jgi:hypothetical protein
MARKTIRKPNKRLSGKTRRRRRDTPAPATAAVESHRLVSSMTYDGNTLVTRSQKDNEPVKQRIYTMKQLEQELPIGKELIDLHLDGKMPQGIQEHHRNKHKHTTPMFHNVLVHPADLGLLAPKVDVRMPDKHHSRRRHRHRRLRDDDNLRLMVDADTDTDADADADAEYGIQHKRPRNLFDLP